MTNQTQKKGGTLNNLKEIYAMQKSGKISALIEEVRKNVSKANSLSNAFNSKMKEKAILGKKEEELAKIQAKELETQKKLEQARLAEEMKQKQQEEERLAERKLFQQQIENIPQKKPARNDPKPFLRKENKPKQFGQNSQTPKYDQKRTFNPDAKTRTFNSNNRPQGTKPGFNTNGQKPPFNRSQGGQRPNGTARPTFASSKENKFKKFTPAPEPMIVQQERSNYGNKNKSGFNKTRDEKRPGQNRRMQTRRGFIDLDINNEERVTIRKLAKPKKKAETFVAPSVTSAVINGSSVTVKTLSEKIGKPAGEIIKKLMMLGVMATINSTINFETAELVASDFDITLEQKVEQTFEEKLMDETHKQEEEGAIKRPPVVTVMGHVDHGKTSLLDAIRKTSVASGEAGGITQKIGAYSITAGGEKITFIDTPGHAAFTAMRARGAQVTDIAILVVAADDGIMPQTVEAISHIKAANVPIIVAVNKMDKPEANLDRVKSGLAENGVLPEDWGGDAILVPLSAKTGVGIDKLLESILLVSEMEELKANPNKMATGVVIEAELDKNRGPVATVLVQSGTLKVGDSVMSGLTFGKVRAMFDENGKQVKTATPSTPVAVLGFNDVPNSGDQVFAVDEKLSKNVISERKNKIKEDQSRLTSGVSLDDFMNKVNEGKLKSLNIIIKADVQGSVEALKQTLTAIENEEVRVVCIHSAVGAVTESDLVLAEASGAIIVNFNLKVAPKIQTLADRMKVEVKSYNVIYEVVEELTDAISGMMTVKYEQVVAGHAEVRVVFKLSTYGLVAGSYVKDGKIIRGAMARLIRDGEIIADTEISALKIVKDDKAEVNTGFECGIKLADIPDLKEGDIIECYENIPIKRTPSRS